MMNQPDKPLLTKQDSIRSESSHTKHSVNIKVDRDKLDAIL